jgi:hypothetical protein
MKNNQIQLPQKCQFSIYNSTLSNKFPITIKSGDVRELKCSTLKNKEEEKTLHLPFAEL